MQKTINNCDIIKTEDNLEKTNNIIEEIINEDNFNDFEFHAQSDCENKSEVNSDLENVINSDISIGDIKRKKKCINLNKPRKKVYKNKDEIICNKDKVTTEEQLLFQCCKCEKSFDNKVCLKKHEQGHVNVKGYFCDICQKSKCLNLI